MGSWEARLLKKLQCGGCPRVNLPAAHMSAAAANRVRVLLAFVVFSSMVHATDTSAVFVGDDSTFMQPILASSPGFINGVLAFTFLEGAA